MGIEFTNNLNKIQEKISNEASRVSGDISFEVLFNPNFMSKYTSLKSMRELFEAGNYEINSKEDFEAIPEDEFNEHVKKYTKFSSWKEMYTKAGQEYIISNFKL